MICKRKFIFHVIIFVSMPREVADHNQEVPDPVPAGSGTNKPCMSLFIIM